MRCDLKVYVLLFKILQDLEIVDFIKCNVMGKVNKKDLIIDVFGDKERIRRRSVSGCKQWQFVERNENSDKLKFFLYLLLIFCC